MNENLINSHDKFFKELFSRQNEVKEFVLKTFPVKLTQKLKLETLELDKTEYVDKKLKTSFSDIVYNCVYGKDTKIKISLLFEHKSYPESYPHLQLLGYMLNIWQTQIKQKQDLVPVIPIIFYHGDRKWTQKPFEKYFEEIDETLQKFIPKFDYLLIDTSTFTDRQIKDLFESLELQIGLLIMKNIYNEQKILQEITEIFAGINQIIQTEHGEQFFETIITYLFYATELETSKIVEKMRTISPKAGEKFVSTAMRLQLKGKIEGRVEGIEKVAFSMLKKGYSYAEITELTGLSKLQLDYLKSLDEYQLDIETI
ncbi:MAG: Rpn family recombination-promoting nuclease/putative transposase [Bacteroidales bacterium]|nr:Rpn family recombination-promoting nuclease/putative transposase [Bacteroidales bacterium]